MRLAIFLLAVLGAFAGVASPLFQKVFIDRVMGTESLETARLGLPILQQLTPVMAISGAFVATLLAQAIGLFGNFLGIREGTFLQRYFSEELYKKMLSIRPDSLGSTTVGEVVSIYATDVAGATMLIDQVLPMAALIVCNLVLGPLAVYLICGTPLWATLILMGSVILLTMILAIRQSKFFALFKQLAAERTGIVNEWVQSIRLLRILGWVENFESKIFAKRQEETLNRIAMVSNGQLMNAFGSSVNFIINLTGVASLMYLSGRRVSPGELFAMLWIFGVFMQRSFRQLPWFFTFILDSTSSLKRVERFLSRPSNAGLVESNEVVGGKGVAAKAQPVSVRSLNLQINGAKVLDDINFDVTAGEFAAVVGEVGCGKSMLVLSLVGETGATFGTFTVGGEDMLKLNLNQRRQSFAFVPQEGFVMSASLRENIVFRYDADSGPEPGIDDRVFKSLDAAQFHISSEIQGAGLDNEIGERGVNLSGGQRQRVALARAHFFDRSVILLDDCLSAVDVDTERQLVRDLLDGAWRGHTRILVTHRLSVLSLVDRIFFMEHGQIVETGTYKELIKNSSRMQGFVASVLRGETQAEAKIEGAASLQDMAQIAKEVSLNQSLEETGDLLLEGLPAVQVEPNEAARSSNVLNQAGADDEAKALS